MTDYWDRHAAGYDRSVRLLGGSLRRLLPLVEQEARGATRALEVGAGTGLVTIPLAKSCADTIATDSSAEMVVQLRSRLAQTGFGELRVQQAGLPTLPFPDEAFDLVLAANLLHLLPDEQEALRELRRVLAPRGRLLVPTYCHAEGTIARAVSAVLGLTGFPGRRRYSLRTLREAVAGAGMRVERAELVRGMLPIGFVVGRS